MPLKSRASSTVRRIGHKRPPCYLRRGPGGLPYKFLLLPDALGHAAVAVLHAVVEIIRRNGAERLVVEALQSQPLLQILLRSEEHTSELQSPCNLVCRLL